MLELAVFDETTVLVGERQLVTVVRAEDIVAGEVRLARDRQLDLLVLAAQVAQKECRAEDLAANELAIVDHVRVHVDDRVDVDLGSRLGLNNRLDLLLTAVDLSQQRFSESPCFVLVSLALRRADDFLGACLVSSLNIDVRLLLLSLFFELPHPLDRRFRQCLALFAGRAFILLSHYGFQVGVGLALPLPSFFTHVLGGRGL